LVFVAFGAFNLILPNHAKTSPTTHAAGDAFRQPGASFESGSRYRLRGFAYCTEKADDIGGGQ
jgi:hypothetical protein